MKHGVQIILLTEERQLGWPDLQRSDSLDDTKVNLDTSSNIRVNNNNPIAKEWNIYEVLLLHLLLIEPDKESYFK